MIESVAEQAVAGVLVDSKGLLDSDADGLMECSIQEESMALLDGAAVKDGLVFDLGGSHLLESVLIWNYNKPANTGMGTAKAKVSVWTEAGGWQTVVEEAEILEAEGTPDYDEPTVLRWAPVTAQKVRLENMVCFNGQTNSLGLSKIRFYSPAGFAACDGVPADKSQVPFMSRMPISWSSGKNALVHAVYLGDDPNALTVQGKLKGVSRVDVEGLRPKTTYYWSIDEIQQDGAVTKGPLWSFTTQESSCEQLASVSPIRLVNASFVTDDQSLDEIAKQAEEPDAAPVQGRKNLTAILLIAAAVVGMVFVSTFKKKQ